MAVWLDAWLDPVSSIHTVPSCIRLVDVTGDGDPKLLVADQNRKLRMYKGVNLASEHALLDTPSAICAFYDDIKGSQAVNIPSLAVACGHVIFVYKRLRPYYKFALPMQPVDPAEADIWNSMRNGSIQVSDGWDRLSTLRDGGTHVTYLTDDLLAYEGEDARRDFLSENKEKPLVHSTTITCMEGIPRREISETASSCLCIGTESRQVVILDPQGFSIVVKAVLPSVPAFICVTGMLEVDYRVVCACRDGRIYTIKNGQLLGTSIELETPPIAMCLAGKTIVVGTLDKALHGFSLKGKRCWAHVLPSTLQTLSNLDDREGGQLFLASLGNGDVRLYKDKQVLSTMKVPGGDMATAMRFGKYAREDGTLLIVHQSGALGVKILSRKSDLSKSSEVAGPPPEQDVPLNVPKKTKLYVEQTQRERDNSCDMHRIFQKELCKLRLQTARAYVKVLTDGQGPISYSHGSSLKLNAQVMGLGPTFKIVLVLTNAGSKPITDCSVIVVCDADAFILPKSVIPVSTLVPGPEYSVDVDILAKQVPGYQNSQKYTILLFHVYILASQVRESHSPHPTNFPPPSPFPSLLFPIRFLKFSTIFTDFVAPRPGGWSGRRGQACSVVRLRTTQCNTHNICTSPHAHVGASSRLRLPVPHL